MNVDDPRQITLGTDTGKGGERHLFGAENNIEIIPLLK